jgi:mannose-6-phosphate isomerase
MDLLANPIRGYAWGSRTVIATLQGRPAPSEQPEAELWMGAHPADSSRLVRDGQERTLFEVVGADPGAELGDEVAAEYGPHLPFLLKLIAAEQPLSIQAHPDADQAQLGFAAEEAAGIARDDPRRNYVDPHHKPELLCAVSDFEALCGFREPAAVLEILAALDAPLMAEYAAPLRDHPDVGGLRATLTGLLTLGAAARTALVRQVVVACQGRPEAPYALVASLAERCPEDIGVVVALLLNHVRLASGEAVFIPAGMPHAYLYGVGIEVLACSDNVVRGGLTPKRVDVTELLRLLRFEPGEVTVLPHEEPAPGVRVWRPPVREFALTRVTLAEAGGAVNLPASGPRILFCLAGAVHAENGLGGLGLKAGQAVFVPAGRGVEVSGEGTVFQATTA